MTRDDDFVGQGIKAVVSFVMSRVGEKNTQGGARDKLVWSSGGQVQVTFATEDKKMTIGWRSAEKGKVRCGEL